MSIAPINGIKIYYEKFGNGSPIIFIHGAYGGIDSSVTPRKNDWVDKLKGSHTVITYDRRSAGRSSYPDEVHSIDILASDLSELINYLELKNPIVIGSSAGGLIALRYAFEFQKNIKKLILVNTSYRMWKNPTRIRASQELIRRHEILEKHGIKKAYDILMNEPAFITFYMSQDDIDKKVSYYSKEEAKKLSNELSIEDTMKYYMGELRNQFAYVDLDYASRLNEIIVDTLVIHGDADVQVPYSLGVELAKGIKGSKFITIPGAGHGLMANNETINHIKEFCGNLDENN